MQIEIRTGGWGRKVRGLVAPFECRGPLFSKAGGFRVRGRQKQGASSKLFNPDPIPLRRILEPEAIHREERSNAAQQLFDHRKDDPIRFAASSTTNASSASSALFEGRPNRGQGTEDSSNNVFSIQLRKLYHAILNLETKIKQEDSMDETEDGMNSRVMLKGKEVENDELEREDGGKELAEIMHNLLEISLAPSEPASLRNIPTKYSITVRLRTYTFHKLLESLLCASSVSPLALGHLQDFIYYAYTFYTGLLEEPTLNSFKLGWLETLGDLARYRMAVAAMVNGGVGGQGGLHDEGRIKSGCRVRQQTLSRKGWLQRIPV
ncbi:hypothetical protein NLJ89_g10508 [Agrocybe chaxingu]|uniref:Uncharacterized protein n=1 Tax=Agrocybe chaxingu TaxID=84603 RepID=A0A9W8JYK2_9AGAR|nr:hypothetical protein NLJ89_g10508 [Agrocybe chaxingu]